MKTAYYTDQDFERFMLRSEGKLKCQFCVLSACSAVCQFAIWYVLLTNSALSGNARLVIIVVSILALLCLAGLGYCYFSVRRDRLDYQKMRHEQQEELNALIDEIQSARKKMMPI